MAYIWHMSVNFSKEEFARSFEKHYDHSMIDLPHAGKCEPRVSVEKNDSGWEVHVLPYVDPEGPDGVSHGGPWHLNGHGGAKAGKEVEDLDACAKVLFDRLRNIHNYRFAFVGWEVGDWRSAGGLLDDLSEGGLYVPGHKTWGGLVVSKDLYEAAGMPEGFVKFSGEYLWVPYTSAEDG